MQIPQIILIANFASTFYMTGLIWMVQVVHYPLFAKVGTEQYVPYQTSHQTLTTIVVGPPMLIELLTAALLLWLRPVAVPLWLVVVGLILLILIWISTACIQVPCHEKLTRGFDANVHARLVISNWIRTIGWTARGAIVIWMLVQAIKTPPTP